jgi:hypothetical protein
MSSLPSLTLVARIILSVQNCRTGAEELQPANSNGLASFLGVPGEIRRRRFQARGNRRSLPARGNRRRSPHRVGRWLSRQCAFWGAGRSPQPACNSTRPAPAPTSQSCLIDPALPGYGRPFAYRRYTGAEAANRFRRRSSKRREKCTRSTVGGCTHSAGLIFGLLPRRWGDLSARFWARPPTVCR